jgi:hypothetical protein
MTSQKESNMSMYMVSYTYNRLSSNKCFEDIKEAKEFIKSIILDSFSVDLYSFKNNEAVNLLSHMEKIK